MSDIVWSYLQSLHPNVYTIVLISSLENNEKAQEDARMALEIDKKDIKAIMAKAESLFAGGHFELGNYMLWSINMVWLIVMKH